LRGLTYRQRLTSRGNLNGIQPRGVATPDKCSNKAEKQNSPNTRTSEHANLPAFPASGRIAIKFHRRVRLIKMGRRKDIPLTHVRRSVLVPTLCCSCFKQTDSHFSFCAYPFENTGLGTNPLRTGVVARIQGLAGQRLGVHSHTFLKTPGSRQFAPRGLRLLLDRYSGE
jgi:hypothetical protein